MKRILAAILLIGLLAGCALATRYVSYTDQTFGQKPKFYFITVYPLNALPASSEAYTVIGRVEVSGYLSSGINQDTLLDKAKAIARQRGADAIINAKFGSVDYRNVDVVPGSHGYYHYRRPVYYVTTDRLLTFQGELIVFMSRRPDEQK